jgi:hypothetical protein
MEFTQIPKEEVKVIPATEEKVFDKYWVSHLRINSTPELTRVIAHLNSFNGEEILDDPEQIVIRDLWADMADENIPAELRTKYAELMELILQTIKMQKEYEDSKVSEDDTINSDENEVTSV